MAIIKVDYGSLSDYSEYVLQYNSSSVATSHTLSDMKGKKLLVLKFYYNTSSNFAYNRYDGATCTGGNITKISNLLTGSARVAGTFYLVEPTTNSCTITTSNSGYLEAFEAV